MEATKCSSLGKEISKRVHISTVAELVIKDGPNVVQSKKRKETVRSLKVQIKIMSKTSLTKHTQKNTEVKLSLAGKRMGNRMKAYK